MGTARAKLSDQYINEHKAKIQKLDASDAGKDESKKGDGREGSAGRTLRGLGDTGDPLRADDP